MTDSTDDCTRREWDAPAYDTLNAPMTARGNDAVARLELRGDETVLDAGCGTGEVTATLLERLPRGRVVALDGSRADAGRGARALRRRPARVVRARGPRAAPLPRRAAPVDAIVSTSTFHWVRDHDALFRHLAAVLRPGGQLVVDCGGAGNIAAVLEILASSGTPSSRGRTRASRRRGRGCAPPASPACDVRLVPRVSRFTRASSWSASSRASCCARS